MATHMRFTVKVADHEAEDPSWRLQHAAETFAIVYAYFESDRQDRTPTRADDGTFAVHAPSWSTLDGLRRMVDHEGMTVVREEEVPGAGLLMEVPR